MYVDDFNSKTKEDLMPELCKCKKIYIYKKKTVIRLTISLDAFIIIIK